MNDGGLPTRGHPDGYVRHRLNRTRQTVQADDVTDGQRGILGREHLERWICAGHDAAIVFN